MVRLSLSVLVLTNAVFAVAAEPPARISPNSVTVEAVNSFSNVTYIPQGAELTSIRFEKVRRVKIATEKSSTMRLCDNNAGRNPADSMYCPYIQLRSSSAPAYEVTYSYRGEPLASDEYGSRTFTFSVYFRPEALSPEARQKLSAGKAARSDAEKLFALKTETPQVQSAVFDEEGSKVCSGSFVEGSWHRADPNCVDRIAGKTVTAPSPYVTVSVNLAPAWRTE